MNSIGRPFTEGRVYLPDKSGLGPWVDLLYINIATLSKWPLNSCFNLLAPKSHCVTFMEICTKLNNDMSSLALLVDYMFQKVIKRIPQYPAKTEHLHSILQCWNNVKDEVHISSQEFIDWCVFRKQNNNGDGVNCVEYNKPPAALL